jgi:hypothetical protein
MISTLEFCKKCSDPNANCFDPITAAVVGDAPAFRRALALWEDQPIEVRRMAVAGKGLVRLISVIMRDAGLKKTKHNPDFGILDVAGKPVFGICAEGQWLFKSGGSVVLINRPKIVVSWELA